MAVYDICPCPKPRMVRSYKSTHTLAAKKYWAFKQECQLKKVTFENGQAITFYIPMPKSWSKNKRFERVQMSHTGKPDIDNLLKALLDAIFKEDSHVHHIGRLQKFWTSGPGRIDIYSP